MFEDVVVGFRGQVVHVAAHRLVVLAQHRTVAVVFIEVERHQHEGAAPLGRVAERLAEERVFGGDVGHQSIGQLRHGHVVEHLLDIGLGHAGEHLLVEAEHVERILQRTEHQVQLLQPRQLLAVRAVGQIAHHVALDTPADEPLRLVEQVVRRDERSRFGRRIADMQTAHVHDFGQPLGVGFARRHGAVDKHVAEAVVSELRRPALGLRVAAKRIGVARLAAVAAVDLDRVDGGIEQFAGVHPHRLSALALDRQTRHAREVLPHVVEPLAVFGLADLEDGELLHDLHRQRLRGDQLAALRGEEHLLPRRIVVTGLHPARAFERRVVILAAEDAAVRHRTGRRAPAAVADDHVVRAVGIFDVHLANHHRVAVGHQQFVVAFARHVVHAVAEHHAQHVGALLQTVGHVEGDVADDLVVVAPRRIEEVVAYLVAVDEELELPQTRDVGHGPFHRFPDVDLAAELRQTVGCRDAVADREFVILLARHQTQAVGLHLHGDPAGSRPCVGRHQPRREAVDRHPGRDFARSVPDAHAPIILLARFERLACVRDVERLRALGLYPPQIAAAGSDGRTVVAHDQFVGRLQEPAVAGADLPRETGRQRIDTQRFIAVFATGIHHRKILRGRARRRAEQRKQKDCPFFHRQVFV